MVEFSKKKHQLQAELKNDIDKINQCLVILVFADKTSNIYKMDTKIYQKLLQENITVG